MNKFIFLSVFLIFYCKRKSSDGIEMASIVVESFFILVVFFPNIVTSRLFGTHILENAVGRQHKDLLNHTDLDKNCSKF